MKEIKENLHITTYRGHDAVGEIVSELTIPKYKFKSYIQDNFEGYSDLKLEIIRWEIGGNEKIHKLKL